MLFKILVILALALILLSLGTALFMLVQDKGKSDRSVKALTYRIGLSVALFLFLMIGYATGIITPHGL